MDTEKMVKKGKYWVYETGWYKDRRIIIKEIKVVKEENILDLNYKFKKVGDLSKY
jgi:hypothetical protein